MAALWFDEFFFLLSISAFARAQTIGRCFLLNRELTSIEGNSFMKILSAGFYDTIHRIDIGWCSSSSILNLNCRPAQGHLV